MKRVRALQHIVWPLLSVSCVEPPATDVVAICFAAAAPPDGEDSGGSAGDDDLAKCHDAAASPFAFTASSGLQELRITVGEHTATGKKIQLWTSSGTLSRGTSNMSGGAMLELVTTEEAPLSAFLRAETAGAGVVTVTTSEGPTATALFEAVRPDLLLHLCAARYDDRGSAYRTMCDVSEETDELQIPDGCEVPEIETSSNANQWLWVTLDPCAEVTGVTTASVATTRGVLGRTTVALTRGRTESIAFFPGLSPGPGTLSATVEGATPASLPFDVAAATETITFGIQDAPCETCDGCPQAPVADGRAFGIALTLGGVAGTLPQEVSLATVRVGFKADPAAAGGSAKKEMLTPNEPKCIGLYSSAEPGPAELSATLPSGAVFAHAFEIGRLSESLAIDRLPAGYTADGTSSFPATVRLTSDGSQHREVRVTVSAGVLDPSATTEEAKKTKILTLEPTAPGDSALLTFFAPRTAGSVLFRAESADEDRVLEPAEISVVLERSLPEYVYLTATRTIFDSIGTNSSLSAVVGRTSGGQVSEETPVYILGCCTPEGSAEIRECNDHLDLPAAAVAALGTPDAIPFQASLGGAGISFVDAQGVPPTDDLEVTVHAYVVDAAGAPALDCSVLADSTTAIPGVASRDALAVRLRHRAAPPAEVP